MLFLHRLVLLLVLLAVPLMPVLAAEDMHALVDINTADAETLDRGLVNVGPAKAEAIIAYRREHGPFRRVEQLALVKGIGLKTIERNRQRIVLGTLPAAPVSRRSGPAGRLQLQR